MTPIRMVEGLPQQGERPVVLVAAQWPADVPTAKVRAMARDWAALGLTGIVCDHEAAADAARRAGLVAVVPPALLSDAPHLVGSSDRHVTATTSADAFVAALAGERFVLGEFDVVLPLAMLLAVADAELPWQPLPDQGEWRLAQAGELIAAFSAEGGDVQVAVASGQSIHWFDPVDGEPVAISTPEPFDRHTVRVPAGTPMALLIAPSRFQPADVDAVE
ncbi:MAG: hypothetical protein HZB16_09180 [Armatimonadetes bacterium]|nr:hypothetical protein [Armatimonadota bacterium]